jgi:hypothetical protein
MNLPADLILRRKMNRPYIITTIVIVIALLAVVIVGKVTVPEQEYVIPGTISATCGPTLPEYTFCP